MKIQTSMWTRLSTAQKAGIVVAAVLLPVAGVLAGIGAFGGDSGPRAVTTWQSAAPAPSAPAAAAGATPAVEKRTITETEPIKFTSRTVKDNWLPKGVKEPRTAGIDGVRTKTYTVTLVGGRETKRKLIKSEVTRAPVPEVVAIGTNTGPDDNTAGG